MDNQLQINELSKRLENLENEYFKNNFSAHQDFNKYANFTVRLKVPTATSLPATAEIGELFVVSGTGKLYVCSALNTWSIVGTQTA